MEIKDIEGFKKRLQEQKEKLTNAVTQLKKEFIGIDSVIEQIAEAMGSWIYFPEMQERPVIINLWGLTGTGKTSLIKRLAELIGYDDRYFRFDLGESTDKYFDIQDSFKDIYEHCDGEPFIIGLDEFQLARTINEEQEEIDKASSRTIWDLLDSGKFDLIDFSYNMGWFNKLIKNLLTSLERGVEVEKGVVIRNEDIYKEMIPANRYQQEDEEEGEEKKKVYFVPDDNVETIYNMVDFLFLSKNELREKLNDMDGEETIDYLIFLYKKILKPRTVDCSKALVFVMGNLDEVYSMTRNFNPDISANEFHRQSTEITITQVKDALLTRFRSEQIARLGNIHIIYPAFDENAFYSIINLELEKTRKKVKDIYGIELEFSDKIKKLIYNEGVYPTQGTRPLFTTIHQIINTRLGKILNEVYLQGYAANAIEFTIEVFENEKDCAVLEILFKKEGAIIHRITDAQTLVLGKLRKEKRNDEQAIVAVHESGHAILSSLLMKTVPESVFSITADNNSEGFILARPEWNYISKKEIINRLAVLLGGFVAEKIIFGEENVTMGSNSDLSKATQLATYVLYTCGMGSTRMVFGNENMDHTPTVIFDNEEESINIEAKKLLVEAEALAEKTLEKQKILLVKMADYLSDKRSLSKEQVKEFLTEYAVDFTAGDIVENAHHLFYRNHLKNMAKDC